MGFIGLTAFIGVIGFIGFMGFIGFEGLVDLSGLWFRVEAEFCDASRGSEVRALGV